MSGQFPRGSEWRKWDLHIHTPQSIVQQYGGDTPEIWNQFVAKISSLPSEVKVLGICDYLFIDGYEKLKARKSEFPNIALLIPNIEFRLDTFAGTTNSKRRHNFHVLFDTSVSIPDIREQLLNCLSKGYHITDKSEWQQTPTVRSLSDLGRQIKQQAPEGNPVRNKTDLQVGFDNITYSREDIMKCLEGKSCFRGKYVTAIGFSEWDQARWDQSAAEKRDLINRSHFAMTCVNDPAKIAEHRIDLKNNNLNPLILHGSDAHRLEDVGTTLQWIKADPTFAGLKQVMNEPEERVFIGDAPPNFKADHKVIQRIIIRDSKNWFPNNFELPLNRDLVTIIGGRGSGKSALAEAIAYGAGSSDPHSDAFLRKADRHQESISGATITTDWADGTTTTFEVGKLKDDAGLVRYLPQGAVEELCAPEHSGELQRQIENVIFQALDETERLGASNFKELQSKALRQFTNEKRQLSKKISEANARLSGIIWTIEGKGKKQEDLKQRQEELKRLRKSLPKLPEEDQKAQDELATLEEQKRRLEEAIATRQGTINVVDEVQAQVESFGHSITEFEEEIGKLLSAAEIPLSDEFKVNLNRTGIAKILNERATALKGEIDTIRSGEKEPVGILCGISTEAMFANNLKELGDTINRKSKETRAYETQKLKYQQQKKVIQETETAVKAIKLELENIDSVLLPEQKHLEEERLKHYCDYFEILQREKTKIEALYTPLQASLLAGSETKKRLVFEAKIHYRIKEHCDVGLNILDRTRRGNFRELRALGKALDTAWEECMKLSINEASTKARLASLEGQFRECEGQPIDVVQQLKEGLTIQHYYNWLYDPEYFEVVSSLKFDGVDLYLLSPGQKGIILMMLYLAIDKDDCRPLIIDQPEENLDNLSVYSDLMQYFRERKVYRQIIMVTHNPNLVVNTDAEQVIIANYHGERQPRLQYTSGSLENQAEKLPNVPVEDLEDGILEQVCDILEGGKTAFGNRNRKYQLSEKVRIA
ncbi:putative ATPase involved in DNA repair [Candidatus Zixiibacteriota bacterium]|nr:putative ATPase involved in DNA repair [candidate division Zixibacteria bacterium]